jgi:toxin ParE1/3/4
MRRVRYHAAAAEEAERAAEWYTNEKLALGLDFEQELGKAIDLLRREPIPAVPYPRIAAERGVRRLILKRFPYDLVFVERGQDIVIVALAHHARRPGYWRDRLRA